VLDAASSKLVSKGKGDGSPTVETKEEIPFNIKSTSAGQGTPSKGTRSDKGES
jgi:hypothetical protein